MASQPDEEQQRRGLRETNITRISFMIYDKVRVQLIAVFLFNGVFEAWNYALVKYIGSKMRPKRLFCV